MLPRRASPERNILTRSMRGPPVQVHAISKLNGSKPGKKAGTSTIERRQMIFTTPQGDFLCEIHDPHPARDITLARPYVPYSMYAKKRVEAILYRLLGMSVISPEMCSKLFHLAVEEMQRIIKAGLIHGINLPMPHIEVRLHTANTCHIVVDLDIPEENRHTDVGILIHPEPEVDPDPDYGCMHCFSHKPDQYETEKAYGEGWLMWTYCKKCDDWTSHPLARPSIHTRNAIRLLEANRNFYQSR
jgi:Pyruvate/2-oxoacid:ferredoxin oxidoreductase delta subunit